MVDLDSIWSSVSEDSGVSEKRCGEFLEIVSKMGCCSCNPKDFSGLVVPDQELVINEIELSHPFARLSVENLLSTLTSNTSGQTMTKSEFLEICNGLGIVETDFDSPPYAAYIEALESSVGVLDRTKVLMTAVLLGKGDFHCKLAWMLTVCELSVLSRREVVCLMKDLVQAAAVILPSMAKSEVPPASLSLYLARLRLSEPLLVCSVITLLRHGQVVTAAEFTAMVAAEVSLQKLCWANGVRLILVEEDIKALRTSQSEQCGSVMGVDGKNTSQGYDQLSAHLSRTEASPLSRGTQSWTSFFSFSKDTL